MCVCVFVFGHYKFRLLYFNFFPPNQKFSNPFFSFIYIQESKEKKKNDRISLWYPQQVQLQDDMWSKSFIFVVVFKFRQTTLFPNPTAAAAAVLVVAVLMPQSSPMNEKNFEMERKKKKRKILYQIIITFQGKIK